MVRTHGWYASGAPLKAYAPHGTRGTMTFIGALRTDGLTAPMVLKGAINADIFYEYVKQILLPTLKQGNIVMLDNLSSHKSARVIKLIRSVGAKIWFLPAYSPDLNPIEQNKVFSKIKRLLRKAYKRTLEKICKRVAKLIGKISPEERLRYIKNSGYGAT
ncbi:MAG: IS630 family transposase [Pseudomonadota bacterium]